MYKNLFSVMLLLTLVCGCNSQSDTKTLPRVESSKFINGIYLGQDQTVWERVVSQHKLAGRLKPYVFNNTEFNRFYWLLKDTVVCVDITFNGGGFYNHGVLKNLEIDLTTSKDSQVEEGDMRPVRVSTSGYGFENNKYCSKAALDKIHQYLERQYGIPDTSKYDYSVTFTYETRKDIIHFTHDSTFSNPREGIPVPYYTNARIAVDLKEAEK